MTLGPVLELLRYSRFGSILALTLGAACCKPRTPPVDRLLSDDQSTSKALDPKIRAEVARVVGACEVQAATRLRGVRPDGSGIDYATTDATRPTTETGQAPWYESASFDGERWALSAPILSDRAGAECLHGVTSMSTSELLAALGCGGDGACARPEAICEGASCPTSLAQVEFLDLPRGGIHPSLGGDQPTAIALSDDRPTCQGGQLQTPSGRSIGESVEDETHCGQLADTANRGVVCAWTGRAFLPARLQDGKIIGNGTGGSTTLALCAHLTESAGPGSVCSWTGQSFAPYSVAKLEPIGGADQSPDPSTCVAKTAAEREGRLCSWGGSGIAVFDVGTRSRIDDLGSFLSFDACLMTLEAIAVPGGVERRQALVREGIKAPVSADTPSSSRDGIRLKDGESLEDGALGLVDDGWTWGDCNDPQRAYHLVAVRNRAMVCQGRIDTLYSWGPFEKIVWLNSQPWRGQLERDGKDQPIFASQSAIATFGYGVAAIRFKLRSRSHFRFFDRDDAYTICGKMTDLEKHSTVAVRYWDIGRYTGVDYILCSLGPVHSWSIGTAQHVNEMSRESTWVSANDYRHFELYVKQNGADDVYPDGLDGHRFTPDIYTRQVSAHQSIQPGKIVYNPGESEKTEQAHFGTAWPTYINNNRSSGARVGERPQILAGGDQGPGDIALATFRAPDGTTTSFGASRDEVEQYRPAQRYTYSTSNGTLGVRWYDDRHVSLSFPGDAHFFYYITDTPQLCRVANQRSNVPLSREMCAGKTR